MAHRRSPGDAGSDPDRLIGNAPILRFLPMDARRHLAAQLTKHRYRFGEVVVRQGEAADAYFWITEGRARVLIENPDGMEVHLHGLGPGDGFGEIGLLRQTTRTATVRASGELTVRRCRRQDFNDIIARYPQLREFLELQLQQRSLENFLRRYTDLATTPVPALTALIHRLEPHRAAPGEALLREGNATGALFILQEGSARVVHKDASGKQALAYLGPGDFCGERSLLSQALGDSLPATASVVAATECRLLRLDANSLREILDDFPELRSTLQERLARGPTRSDRVPLDIAQAIESETPAQQPEAPPAPPLGSQPRPQWFWRWLARDRLVAQRDESDCGAAALATICRAYGRPTSLSYLRELTRTTARGTTLRDLCHAAGELGLAARAVHVTASQFADIPCPAILHWEPNHWVVALKRTRHGIQLGDPAGGIRWLRPAVLQRHCSGSAILFNHVADESLAAASAPRPVHWTWILPLLRGGGGLVALTGIVTLAICALILLFPILTQKLVDEVLIDRHLRFLQACTVGLGASLCGVLLLTLWQRRLFSRAAERIDSTVTGFLLAKLLALPLRYFEVRRATDIERRLASARSLHRLLLQDGLGCFTALCQLACFVGLMAHYQSRMTLVFLILVPVYAVLMHFSGKLLRPAYAQLEEDEYRARLLEDDMVNGIADIKSAAAEKRVHGAMADEYMALLHRHGTNLYTIFGYEGTAQAIGFFAIILFLWLGLQLIAAQQLSIGSFIAFQMLVLMSYSPLLTLLQTWRNVQAAIPLFGRLDDVVETPPEGADPTLRPVPSLAGKIQVRGVCFRYGGRDDPTVLQDITFAVEPGATVAIVGRSGAGKTTLVKCLAALLAPDKGQILYDNVEASRLRPQELRRHVGLVFQEPHVFSTSVVGNIAHGTATPDLRSVMRAARLANAHDFIVGLPQGYETELGGAANLSLSPGRRQQLALARALYRDPPVLILDEATSSLDRDSQTIIQANLLEVLRDRTTFIVSHQLSQVRHADLILVLDQGRLIERGTHDVLMARQGLYYHLFRDPATSANDAADHSGEKMP